MEKLREQIEQDTERIKDSHMLEVLASVSSMLRKKSEDDRLLTDAERERSGILSKISEIEDAGRLRRLKLIAICQ